MELEVGVGDDSLAGSGTTALKQQRVRDAGAQAATGQGRRCSSSNGSGRTALKKQQVGDAGAQASTCRRRRCSSSNRSETLVLKQQRVGDAGAQAAMALRRVEEEHVRRNGGVGRGSPAEEEEERARKGWRRMSSLSASKYSAKS